MKAFIVYINHPDSKRYANQALKSFADYSGWEPTLFEGITPETLPSWESRLSLRMKKLSRVAIFRRENMKLYNTKKSCALNHYRLYQKCVELNEPVAFIEHDSHCVRDWIPVDFDDVLVLNPQSGIKQKVFKHLWPKNLKPVKQGIHDIDFTGLHYRFDPEINGQIPPGVAAYAITPRGAQKMIDVYENVGWEQSDFILNTHYVRIQTIMPELFTFKLPNLSMSHGKHEKHNPHV